MTELPQDLAELLTINTEPRPRFEAHEIRRETVQVTMRDGTRLATDLYMPPLGKAPGIIERTPYGRTRRPESLTGLAQQGYVVVAQDCRGTGESEPDRWDYYVFEPDDSFDTVAWAINQPWYDGFLGGCGGSYLASTQWCMAAHPRMSTIVPEVGGLGVVFNTAQYYMFLNAYARSVGKGPSKVAVHFSVLERQMLEETLAGGYFNEPLERPLPTALLERETALQGMSTPEAKLWIWQRCVTLPVRERLKLIELTLGIENFSYVDMEHLCSVFGQGIAFGGHAIPRVSPDEICTAIQAPALIVTGWYDWGLNDSVATWELLTREGQVRVKAMSRLLITPSAHNTPGYHEGQDTHPELRRNFRTPDITGLLLRWYSSIRDGAVGSWPNVIYYLMGANEWRSATSWPPVGVEGLSLYLGPGETLSEECPQQSSHQSYVYDPTDPPLTVGGSIVSYVYPPGSVDVRAIQQRHDVLVFTTPLLDADLDVVGPLRLILYASSSAVDTDFVARLSDVFPDERAIQLQNGILRTRYRTSAVRPEFVVPGAVYELEIDMWATANRFAAGHRLRIDICSADFPRFDRNANRGGEDGAPCAAVQTIYCGPDHPSRLVAAVLDRHPITFR